MLKKLLWVMSISNFKQIWKFKDVFKEFWCSCNIQKKLSKSLTGVKKKPSWEGEGRKTNFLMSVFSFAESGLVG